MVLFMETGKSGRRVGLGRWEIFDCPPVEFDIHVRHEGDKSWADLNLGDLNLGDK